MANKSALNKSSTYVQSLVSFINDTKPYHSKLTEIVEEYQFFDDLNVKIDEQLLSRTKASAVWLYNYFSSANTAVRNMPLKRVVRPQFNHEFFTVGEDENTDMANVPFVYSKKVFDGPSVSGTFLKHGNFTERLAESVDYFQSHGSFQFQIFITPGSSSSLAGENPTWSSTDEDDGQGNGVYDPATDSTSGGGVVSAAINATKATAVDKLNPSSALNRIKTKLEEIQQLLITQAVDNPTGDNAKQQAQLALTGTVVYDPSYNPSASSLFGILNSGTLPNSYEILTNWLYLNDEDGERGVVDIHGAFIFKTLLADIKSYLDANTPPLFFSMFTDIGQRQSGVGSYPSSISSEFISISNIAIPPESGFEEWTIVSEDGTKRYSVIGSLSGFVGFVNIGENFVVNDTIGFSTAATSNTNPPTVGDKVVLNPLRAEDTIVIGANSPAETWNVIKVNPIAHDKPVLITPRIGYIQSVAGVKNSITIVDNAFLSGTYFIIARADGVTFDISSGDGHYSGVAVAGVPFNDGELAFTIVQGTSKFLEGERFVFTVENLPPQVQDLDIGFGYGLEQYDDNFDPLNPLGNDNGEWVPTIYGGASTMKLNFAYDGRFTSYNLAGMNMVVQPNAVQNRKWRIRPILHNEALISQFNDPVANKSYSIYTTDLFTIEYSDNDFNTVLGTAGTIAPGGTFSSATHGISFKLPTTDRQFICISAPDDNTPSDRIVGGDTISWKVVNPDPTIVEGKVRLVRAASRPQLQLHSDGFVDTPEAVWAMTFTSPTTYTLVAKHGIDTVSTINVDMAVTGTSFKNDTMHFTVYPGDGLAAGDVFTFSTFAEKPTYLVHGSVTGWTAPAKIGEYYWNGYIGFTISKPTAGVYTPGHWVQEDEQYVDDPAPGDILDYVTYTQETAALDGKITIADDCLSISYTFLRKSNGDYAMVRSDNGQQVYVNGNSVFSDRYVKIDLTGVTVESFKVDITASALRMWNGADLVILQAPSAARLPVAGDVVVIEKTKFDRLELNMSAGSANLSDLRPQSIDNRYTGLELVGTDLSFTSPETKLVTGWVPMTMSPQLSSGSIANFNDTVTRFVFTSSVSNETVGVLEPYSASDLDTVAFTWDLQFFQKYLPLNAEANIVVTNSGLNDRVRVRISDSAKFMIGGGALTEDWMFSDMVNVVIKENFGIKITALETDSFNVVVEDGPFGGFLPGYDNLLYDQEDGVDGVYDVGQPPDIYSLIGRRTLSAQQRQDILDQWNFYLSDGELPTTAEQWAYLNEQLGLDPTIDLPNNGIFGVPAVGKAIDVVDRPVNTASTSFAEALVTIGFNDANTFEAAGYDNGTLDTQDDQSVLASGGVLPLPPVNIDPSTTYDSFMGGIELPLAAAKHLQLDESNTWSIPSKIKGNVTSVSVADLNGAELTPLTTDFLDGVITLTFDQAVAGRATILIQTTARTFDISFAAATNEEFDTFVPHISIWLPGEIAPTPVQIVERVEAQQQVGQQVGGSGANSKASRIFRFSFARPTEAKIIVG